MWYALSYTDAEKHSPVSLNLEKWKLLPDHKTLINEMGDRILLPRRYWNCSCIEELQIRLDADGKARKWNWWGGLSPVGS